MTEKPLPGHGRGASAREHEAGHDESGAPDSKQGDGDEEVGAEVVFEVERRGGRGGGGASTGAGDEEGVCGEGEEEML